MGGRCTEGFSLWTLTDLVVKRKGVFVCLHHCAFEHTHFISLLKPKV